MRKNAESTSPGKSMNASTTIQAFTDAAADAVGREIARLRADAKREEERREADYRARTAELEVRLLTAANLERDLAERLATLKDGEPGKDGEDGAHGHGVDAIEVTQTDAVVEFAFAVGDVRYEYEVELPAGPPGQPGKDAEPAEPGEPGKDGKDGKLTPAAPWVDEIAYEGAVRTHNGATYQALRDTAKEPPHEDWACLAERGVDGSDGRSFNIRDTWNADEEYKALDVVALSGSSFAALKDNPGACPGPDWKLIAGRGKSGRPGEPGRRGEPGPPGPPVKAMTVNDEGLLTLENADGSTVTCDLYPLLSRIDRKS